MASAGWWRVLVSVHQPEFFPWAGFFNKAARAEVLVLLDTAQFKKNYFENRCRIRIGEEARWLTVPVLTKGRHQQALRDVHIDNSTPWGRRLWRTLCQEYAGAQHFAQHAPFLEEALVHSQWRSLVDLNLHLIRYAHDYLELTSRLELASALGSQQHGSELVLDLCRRVGATTYLSGRHGRDYLDESSFARAGVSIVYQDFSPPPYAQWRGGWVGPLSILDAFLNVGKGSIAHVEGRAP